MAWLELALWLFIFIYGFYGLFLVYCTIHQMKRNGKLAQVPWYVRWIYASYLLAGVTCDLLFNVTVGAAVFWEAPWGHGLLFTARCHSHRQDTGWRKDTADWVCTSWLNPAETDHC